MVKERTGEFDRIIGARVRAQRIALKKSLKDIANEVGVTVTAIRLYETGRRQMTATRIERICRALSISPNVLFDSQEKKLFDQSSPAPYGKHVLRIATVVSTMPVIKRRLMQGALTGLNQVLSLIDETDVSAET